LPVSALEESRHAPACDRSQAYGGDVGEDVALLDADIDECVELELRILSRGADAGLAEESHLALCLRNPVARAG
jgi:hypothetical protein